MYLVCWQGTNGDGVDPVWMAKHTTLKFADMWRPGHRGHPSGWASRTTGGALVTGGGRTFAMTGRSTRPTNDCGFDMTLKNLD